MTLRTFARPLWAALTDPYGRRATARELIQARRHAQAVALRDAAECVDLLGDKPVRLSAVAQFLRARADRIETGEETAAGWAPR